MHFHTKRQTKNQQQQFKNYFVCTKSSSPTAFSTLKYILFTVWLPLACSLSVWESVTLKLLCAPVFFLLHMCKYKSDWDNHSKSNGNSIQNGCGRNRIFEYLNGFKSNRRIFQIRYTYAMSPLDLRKAFLNSSFDDFFFRSRSFWVRANSMWEHLINGINNIIDSMNWNYAINRARLALSLDANFMLFTSTMCAHSIQLNGQWPQDFGINLVPAQCNVNVISNRNHSHLNII